MAVMVLITQMAGISRKAGKFFVTDFPYPLH
jgi:hypothetical protein